MKVTLEKSGDYAVRSVLDLALHYGAGRRKNREISEAMDVPSSYLAQLLAKLVRAGLVRATAGQDGGYELAREPEHVSLLEVVEAVEETSMHECVLRGGPCRLDGTCAVHDAWSEAREALQRQLGATSFADIVTASRRPEARTRLLPSRRDAAQAQRVVRTLPDVLPS
ncbi:MAG: Rrf2 family transcriptional regulator [Dehalococcoidia bacterium]